MDSYEASRLLPYLAGMACREFGNRVACDRVSRAPRDARPEWRETAVRVDRIPGSGEWAMDAVISMARAAVASLPWWAGTAKFAELPVLPSTDSQVCSIPASGVSCRATLSADHIGLVMRIDWLCEPVHAPGTWTRRKRHARYRRGREAVRPRHRRSR